MSSNVYAAACCHLTVVEGKDVGGELIYCSDIFLSAFWYQVNQHSLIMRMMLLSQLQNPIRGTASISRGSCVRLPLSCDLFNIFSSYLK